LSNESNFSSTNSVENGKNRLINSSTYTKSSFSNIFQNKKKENHGVIINDYLEKDSILNKYLNKVDQKNEEFEEINQMNEKLLLKLLLEKISSKNSQSLKNIQN
jgi:hypothetical protein